MPFEALNQRGSIAGLREREGKLMYFPQVHSIDVVGALRLWSRMGDDLAG